MRSIKHKFGAIKCQRGDIKFPSKLERSVYDTLEKLRQGGHLLFFLMQVPVRLQGGVRHIIDFLAFTEDEAFFIEAKSKSGRAPVGEIKRKQAEEILGVPIHVVTNPMEVYKVLNWVSET